MIALVPRSPLVAFFLAVTPPEQNSATGVICSLTLGAQSPSGTLFRKFPRKIKDGLTSPRGDGDNINSIINCRTLLDIIISYSKVTVSNITSIYTEHGKYGMDFNMTKKNQLPSTETKNTSMILWDLELLEHKYDIVQWN